MSPIERAVAAINNTAIVRDISSDQQGVLGRSPFFAVTNPQDVAMAVIKAIRDIDLNTTDDAEIEMLCAGCAVLPEFDEPMQEDALACWQAMIDAAIAEADHEGLKLA